MIKKLIFGLRYKMAVRKADKLHKATKRKFLVVVLGGKPAVLSKRKVRNLIATRYFRKGTTVRDIEDRALYIAQ
ncbi:MAG: hypothetical protein IJ605_00070 [Prevotella sp.]|nr:hypothetical protein [Prevotella sp.]